MQVGLDLVIAISDLQSCRICVADWVCRSRGHLSISVKDNRCPDWLRTGYLYRYFGRNRVMGIVGKRGAWDRALDFDRAVIVVRGNIRDADRIPEGKAVS